MRTNRRIPLVFLTLLLAMTVGASAETMPLSQVKKGMKGYGLTVFEGSRIEKFDVEILGVLNNIGPSQDLILAKVDSAVVQRAGVIAGMSGSPIYIDGKVIGALAYSWQFAREPVAGITPIDEMLRIPSGAGIGVPQSPGATPVSAGGGSLHVAPRMSAIEFLTAITNARTEDVFDRMASGFAAQQSSTMSGARPIATPLSLSSFSADTLARFGKYLDAMNFVAVPSGSTSSSTGATAAKGKFAPGDPIGAVLLNGDFTVAATGTVTHIEGDRIYAFGHPFLDMGEISFPMAQSEIVTVMPSLANSFKFANTGAIVGAFTQDRSVGIMGTVGTSADMIPVELKLEVSSDVVDRPLW
ncbi:MAG: SpoIVB peptidase S55 domain-containing protein, partial [Acidobacteriota bacterium]